MSETAASRRILLRWRRAHRPQTSGRAVSAGLCMAALPLLTVVNAGVGLLLPAWLGPVAFGRYALIVTLFQYGLVFDLGLSQLIDRRVPLLLTAAHRGTLTQFVSHVLWLRLIVAAAILLLGSAALVVLHPFGTSAADRTVGLLSLAAGLAFMLVLGPTSVWRARADRLAFGVVSVAVNLVLAIGRPVGILAGGIMGCFACLAIAYGALAVVVHAAMPPSTRAVLRPRLGLTLLASGIPLFLVAATWSFYMTANRWVLSAIASPTELGEFAFAANVTCLVVGAVGGLSQFYYPRVTAQHDPTQPFSSSGRIVRAHACLLAVMLAITAIGMLTGPGFIEIFYPKYTAAISAMQVLLLSVPSLVVSSWLMPTSLSLSTRPWIDGLLVYPVALALLLAATFFGFRWQGATGAAAGLFVAAGGLLGLQLASLRYAGVLRTRHALLLASAVAVGAALLLPPLLAGPGIGVRTTHLWKEHVAPL